MRFDRITFDMSNSFPDSHVQSPWKSIVRDDSHRESQIESREPSPDVRKLVVEPGRCIPVSPVLSSRSQVCIPDSVLSIPLSWNFKVQGNRDAVSIGSSVQEDPYRTFFISTSEVPENVRMDFEGL